MNRLIHVAKITLPKKKSPLLFLREKNEKEYRWFEHIEGQEQETDVFATNVQESIRLAARKWKLAHFQTLNCGIRFELPQRDEHGCSALFHQMVASYSNSSGTYFDEELGHMCRIDQASDEALLLWKTLQHTEVI